MQGRPHPPRVGGAAERWWIVSDMTARLLDNPEDEIERIKRDAWDYAPIADEFELVVREDQMERACKAVCDVCAQGVACRWERRWEGSDRLWWHPDGMCHGWPIRRAFAKEQEEKP